MATSQFANQSIALSAASDFTASNLGLEAILKELDNASPTGLETGLQAGLSDPLPSSEKDETPQTTPTSESVTPDRTQTAPAQPPSPPPAEPISAVSLCTKAYNQAYKEAKEKHYSEYDCKKEAERCYLNKIPRLHKPENINDFIACVAYAMLINIIRPADGTKILYAAQIATQATQASQTRNIIANRNKSTSEIPK
jgi:hypothetical protein